MSKVLYADKSVIENKCTINDKDEWVNDIMNCPVCQRYINSIPLCRDMRKYIEPFCVGYHISREFIIYNDGTCGMLRAVRYVKWKILSTRHTNKEIHTYHHWYEIYMGNNDLSP